MVFTPQVTKILIYVNLIAGLIFASGGTITAGLATFGHGVGQVVAGVIAVAGVLQMLASGLLQLSAVKAETARISVLATAKASGLTSEELRTLKLAA